MVLLLCRHTLHVKCASKWLQQHTSCPLCKADLLELAAQHNQKFKHLHSEEHELELHDEQQMQQQQLQLQQQVQQQQQRQQAVACLQLARDGSEHINVANYDDDGAVADVKYDSSDEIDDVQHSVTPDAVTSQQVAFFATIVHSSSSDSAASVATATECSPSSAEQSRSQRYSSSSISLKQRLQSACRTHRVAPTTFGATLDDDIDGNTVPTIDRCDTSDETATVVL
jgi:transcription initiation factor TFIID subunit TAF12